MRKPSTPVTPSLTPEEQLCAYYISQYEKPKNPSSSTAPRPQVPHTALADTAATHHFLQPGATPHCLDVQPASGPQVTVANGETITPHSQATLPLSPHLTPKSQHAYVFDDLQTGSLPSLG